MLGASDLALPFRERSSAQIWSVDRLEKFRAVYRRSIGLCGRPTRIDVAPCSSFDNVSGNVELEGRTDRVDRGTPVQVDEGSRELLTINTHRGLYRYNRLPFGVKSAPGIFQQIMDTMLAGLKGTVAYLDDVIVVGQTEKEHDDNLRKCHQVFTVLEADSKKE
ncbi:unnamed protein product [Gongylonema pulchrum]|uniref:Reverse transcriptase domain-containing protein n=1 Tax=Gongylonema pulchrum TaxID=637853 RepID=A0A183E3A1_9BILA|nr:unnamed protein product [Gongylonema pulchrum]